MKKMLTASLILIVVATLGLLGLSSCRQRDKEDATTYLKVYGDSGAMCVAGGIFASQFDDDMAVDYVDETVVATRTETVFGTEIELFYSYTVETFGHTRDSYVSADKRYRVIYQRPTGEIVGMGDGHHPEFEGERISEEETIRIATEFAAEKWDFIHEGSYFAYIISGPIKYSAVAFERIQSGFVTSDFVQIGVNPDGTISSWVEKMVYPDGLPQAIQQAVAKLDQDLCRESVKKYIQDCARKADKSVVAEDFLNVKLDISFNGNVTWLTYVKVTIDGEATTVGFHVDIPMENLEVVATEAIS